LSLSAVPPQRGYRQAYRLRIALCQKKAMPLQYPLLLRVALGIIWSTAHGGNTDELSSTLTGDVLRFYPRSNQSPGRIGSCTPAEYHVTQHHSHFRPLCQHQQLLLSYSWIKHGMRSATGELFGP
jgi:hypothetical protein